MDCTFVECVSVSKFESDSVESDSDSKSLSGSDSAESESDSVSVSEFVSGSLFRKGSVAIQEREETLFRLILEQKFLTRSHVIEKIFRGARSYGERRIAKLKRFGYLSGVRLFLNEPESYLLGPEAIRLIRERGKDIRGNKGSKWLRLEPQKEIELATYNHDKKVTATRFLFESLGLARDWKSEKVLKLGGVGGEEKVPDGLFTLNGKGIAIEVELHAKKVKRYRKIMEIYQKDPRIHYLFYVCGDLSLQRKLLELAREPECKNYFFGLYEDLMTYREHASFRSVRGQFQLEALMAKKEEETCKKT